MKILVDGENLRHQLSKVLTEAGEIKGKHDYFRFDITALLSLILPKGQHTTTYYTTKVRLPKFKIPRKLTQRITEIQADNRRWLAALSNQGIQIIKAGYLRVRESNACIHCGKTTLVLQEKGVDVRLATEFVLVAQRGSERSLAVVSSDSGIIPALEAAQPSQTKILYVCFSEELNRAISAVADETITFTRADVLSAYQRVNNKEKGKRHGK